MDIESISFKHMNVRRKRRTSNLLGFLLATVLSAAASSGCGSKAASAPAPPAPTVEVAPVLQKDVPLEGEWVGTLEGYVNAQIQPK